MVDVRLPASGAIRLRWGLPNAFANFERPTAAELNACLDIADSVSWNDFDFGVQASNTIDDPAITAKTNVQTRGAAQYGGGISFYYPREFDDASNHHSLVYDAVGEPRTLGYVIISIDGDLSTNNTPLYVGGATRDFAVGDFVTIAKVQTGGYAQSITGEEAFRYTISFMPQGDLSVYTVVGTSSTGAVITPATLAAAVGDVDVLTGLVNGRKYTRGLRWESSAPNIASVSQNGVVTSHAAGSATISGTFEPTGVGSNCVVTVT